MANNSSRGSTAQQHCI